MPSPDNALQSAIYTRLTNYAPLTTALGGAKVYDFVAPGQKAPYVLIGEDTLSEWDTKSGHGWDGTVTIHCWDFEKAGRKSVKNILSLIHDALHEQESEIALTGFALTSLRREFQATVQEAGIEGEGDHFYHGVARYRALIEPTT